MMGAPISPLRKKDVERIQPYRINLSFNKSMEPLIRNISDTAHWVAVSGIKDTERPDAIFNDRFARNLAGERGQQIANAIEFTIKNGCSLEAGMFLLDKIVERDVQQSYLPDTTYTDDSTT